jgi:hypothetical protein
VHTSKLSLREFDGERAFGVSECKREDNVTMDTKRNGELAWNHLAQRYVQKCKTIPVTGRVSP